MKEIINAETILGALREDEQWICWRYSERGRNKPAKILHSTDSREPVSVSNPDTGIQFEGAKVIDTVELERCIGFTRSTVHKKMNVVDTLGIVKCPSVDRDTRKTKQLPHSSEFIWLDQIEFPGFTRR